MNISVKYSMVPLEEYATVRHDATLQEAVNALSEAQEKWGKENYPHRAILVLNSQDEVVGKVSQWDVIRALEPKYDELFDYDRLSHFGFNPSFIKGMIKEHNLWEHPLNDICKAAGRIKVADIMYSPQKEEYVEEDASLAQAIHQLIMGRHQSLLVIDKTENIVGVLRLSDVFHEVCRRIQSCEKPVELSTRE